MRPDPDSSRKNATARTTWVVLLVVGAAVVLAMAVARWPRHSPQLIFDASVASDLRQLTQDTWQDFLAVFATRTDCFGDVHIRADYHLAERALYDPATATVTVRVPATPAMLQGALIHEWAHHVEHQCPAHADLRPAFLAALGLPPDAVWRTGEHWRSTPAEIYAEASILAVLGSRPIPTEIRVTPELIELVRQWASGGS